MADVILMLDCETLSLEPNAVITQIGLVGVSATDPTDFLDPPVNSFLPIKAQTQLIPPRHIDGDTIIWWMGQSDSARSHFQNCTSGDDFEELPALVRHFIRGFNRMTKNGELTYELWARGDKDVAWMESLIKHVGLPVPWKYDTVRELRTLMAAAGVDVKDVQTPGDYTKHNAISDCKHQLACYFESIKRLHSR